MCKRVLGVGLALWFWGFFSVRWVLGAPVGLYFRFEALIFGFCAELLWIVGFGEASWDSVRETRAYNFTREILGVCNIEVEGMDGNS